MDSTLSRISDPLALAAYLEMGLGSTASMLGVHRNTLSAPMSRKARAGMTRVLTVLGGLRALVEDEDKAAFWFRNLPIASLGHCTAERLLRDRRYSPVEILKALEHANG